MRIWWGKGNDSAHHTFLFQVPSFFSTLSRQSPQLERDTTSKHCSAKELIDLQNKQTNPALSGIKPFLSSSFTSTLVHTPAGRSGRNVSVQRPRGFALGQAGLLLLRGRLTPKGAHGGPQSSERSGRVLGCVISRFGLITHPVRAVALQ